MSVVIGHEVVGGVPYINGKRAIHDPPKEDPGIELLDGAFSEWRCPECKARLGGKLTICLNACHLSAASFTRFQSLMTECAARVKRRERLISDGKILDAIVEETA